MLAGIADATTMAPKVQVPCDFGREYINVPEHSNLKLKLKNREDYLVNSVIMSYNSPEIKRLTTDLHQTSLEMEDFHVEAVYCFVDALYTGELETMVREIFTDVYKMGRVFKVSWLLAKCTEYFENLVKKRKKLDGNTDDKVYERESKYLFDMARKIQNQDFLKECMFMDMFIQSLGDRGDKAEFVKRFIGGIKLNELSHSMAQQILDMVGEESCILVEGLVKSLRDHPFDSPLSDEFKHLLENFNFASSYMKCRETCDELFDLLDDIDSLTKEDFKFIHHINRKCLKEVSYLKLNDQNVATTTRKSGECSSAAVSLKYLHSLH